MDRLKSMALGVLLCDFRGSYPMPLNRQTSPVPFVCAEMLAAGERMAPAMFSGRTSSL